MKYSIYETADKIKDKIDGSVLADKRATEKVADASRNPVEGVDDEVKEGGQKVKDKGK